MTVPDTLIKGVLDAADLRQRLGVSPPTLMRTVRRVENRLIRIGRGRATRYGLREVWPGLETSRFPVCRVSETGVAHAAGELVTLAARQTVWMPGGTVTEGLPVELADARPSGFLGRHFAAIHAELHLPIRLDDWSDHHVLLALSRRGEDVPGNLVLGEESFARWQTIDAGATTRDDYPAIATATIAGHPPGSSAGGERPKFGVLVDGQHRLVKFAVRTPDPVARRWCDLLVMEALALDVVASHGVSAARARMIETPSYWFLESDRFDRVGARGRLPVLSLAAVQRDPAHTWAQVATDLEDARRLSAEDARRLRWLDAFGACIGNTDRHAFNILLFPDGPRFRLAPAFDQVSMLYAPSADGQVLDRTLARPLATSHTLEVWNDSRSGAVTFWARASDDARLSDHIRRIGADNARMLEA